jgi:ribosomal protein L37AE/L43A
MAKGHKCPLCGTQTVHPTSTNRMKCSKCNSIFDRSRIVGS